MRFFYTLLAGLVMYAGTVSAQTSITQDSVRVDIKGDKMPRSNEFRTWDIGAHIGFTYPNTDIAASDLTDDKVINKLGFGFNVTKFFTHSFALQASFIHAKLSGIDNNKPYRYETTVNYDISLNALIQIGNIAFLKKTPNLGIYGYMGVGVMNVDPQVSLDDGKTYLNGIYSQYQQPYDTMDYSNTTQLTIPFGVGVKYRIARPFSLSLEYTLRTTNFDKLDGWYKLLSEDDAYSYFNVGLTYHLGAKEKPIEWVNPLQTVYADLYDMKDRVDLMSGDKDKDGVADLFDREPATPEGNKVYGDGTSVDIDGDGVPDAQDAEPFSPKGAKVDAAGREIDTDGDGIGDTRDLEPNTPKGTLVNNTGVTIPTGPAGSRAGGASSVMAANGYLPSIFFELNSDVIDKKYHETLASIALVMKANPDLKFELNGNCDIRANVDYNIKLGLRRAENVKKHLVDRYGIDAARLKTVSLGKNSPITQEHRMNRRVDFRVLPE